MSTATCPTCGAENRPEARFCDACGAALVAAPSRGEERKVVSVLFVDIVGSTAAADGADPEDVRATLRPYHERVKAEIERFGGTVEKFVGDAVMAVFGAPVAHEDDAERAVRAALRVLEACEELGVEARAAVNTGEALVSLDARPEAGEALVAGDVVNTAARLQSVAPVGTIVAGEVTWRATRGAIVFEELEAVELKGKAGSVRVWCAREARSRFGVDFEHRTTTPFVGRDHETTLLRETYARALRESSLQLVTITGEPGVGKTRLVTELAAWVDERPEIVFWRQGRCLPYGDGITFWALGEIVKAQAGVLESDATPEALEKLADAVAAVVEESDRDWVTARLAPLVGGPAVEGERAETFAAWRQFFEGLAATRPLVAVIEDLHWADEALVEFLEHLVDWASGVPMLLLCTARPELYERHGGWGGGKRNSATISLAPLDTDETARLLSALLEQAVLPAETQAALLDRAGGNPLYAEEFVRMLLDRGILRRRGRALAVAADGEIPVPETVQALIAARIDTLSPERKAVLQDASVIGKVFWRGAVAEMGGREVREVEEALRDLVRKELLRPARRSSMEGEAELSFWHLSLRDVAYSQIPREARARKHRAAAEWFEALGADPELLAYHYEQALDLASAAGDSALAGELLDPTLTHLVAAARRLERLDATAAPALAARALALAPARHPLRPHALLVQFGTGRFTGMSDTELDRIGEETLAAFRALGDEEGLGATLVAISTIAWFRGDALLSRERLDEAIALLERGGESEQLAEAYGLQAFRNMVHGHPEEGLADAERALAICARHGYTGRAQGLSLQVRGGARADLGDAGGLDDLRESLRLALESGRGVSASVAYINLADYVWVSDGPAAALEIQREGIEFSDRRGNVGNARWGRGESVWLLFELGRWDELLRVADEVATWEREHDHRGQPSLMALTFAYAVRAWRGERVTVAAIEEEFLGAARESNEPQVYAPALGVGAAVACLTGNVDRAAAYAREYEELQRPRRVVFHGVGLPEAVRAAIAAGDVELAERLAGRAERALTREQDVCATLAALLAEARESGDALALYRDAAERWRAFGYVLEEALALLGAARCGGTDAERAEGEALLEGLGVDAGPGLRRASAL